MPDLEERVVSLEKFAEQQRGLQAKAVALAQAEEARVRAEGAAFNAEQAAIKARREELIARRGLFNAFLELAPPEEPVPDEEPQAS